MEHAPLTKRNLEIYTRQGLPRNRKAPSTPTSISTTTATDKGLGIQLNNNRIFYGHRRTKKPKDFATVKEYLSTVRESKSPEPDEEDFEGYIDEVECCENEASLQADVWYLLAKHPRFTKTPGYRSNYNFQWTEVESALTSRLSDAKPDISESYRRDQYPPDAYEALGGALAPTQYNAAMPTLCVEWKGPDGLMPSAEKQCAYDGALMVDAAFQAHEYMNKDPTEFLNKTQALTIATNGAHVDIYSNHVVQTRSGPEYHQCLLQSHHPRDSLKDLISTRRSVRNAQDWCRARAKKTKDLLHAFGRAQETVPPVSPEPSEKSGSPTTRWLWSAEV